MKIDHSIQYQSIPLMQQDRHSRGSLSLLFLMASKNLFFCSPLGTEQLLYRGDGKNCKRLE